VQSEMLVGDPDSQVREAVVIEITRRQGGSEMVPGKVRTGVAKAGATQQRGIHLLQDSLPRGGQTAGAAPMVRHPEENADFARAGKQQVAAAAEEHVESRRSHRQIPRSVAIEISPCQG